MGTTHTAVFVLSTAFTKRSQLPGEHIQLCYLSQVRNRLPDLGWNQRDDADDNDAVLCCVNVSSEEAKTRGVLLSCNLFLWAASAHNPPNNQSSEKVSMKLRNGSNGAQKRVNLPKKVRWDNVPMERYVPLCRTFGTGKAKVHVLYNAIRPKNRFHLNAALLLEVGNDRVEQHGNTETGRYLYPTVEL